MAISWVPFTFLKVSFLVCSLVISYVFCGLDSNLLPDCNTKPSPRHRSFLTGKDEIRDQLFVSTLDGRVSALDLSSGGRVLWSHTTGSSGLFSSSMSKLKVSSKGQVFRLVPSLDGNLYRFNGQTLERLPMNADALLKSSFGLMDDTVITGGKESRLYGINVATGEVRYTSAIQETAQTNGEMDSAEDLLLIQRVSHTVRAVESRSGEERWNFSVGEHFLSFREGLFQDCGQSRRNREDSSPKISSGESLDCPNCKKVPQRFQVDAKEGFIGTSEGNVFSWSHKFDSPIVQAWHLKNDKLEAINLFEQRHFLHSEGPDACSKLAVPADLYFGIHQEEYYIQHSQALRAKLLESPSSNSLNGPDKDLLRIEFKPYLLSGSSRTPHINIGKQTPAMISSYAEDQSTAVALKQDYLDYPFDAGFYLYSNTQAVAVENETDCNRIEDRILDFQDDKEEETFIIITSLWHWWKEVLSISIATSILVNLFITPIVLKRMRRKLLAETSESLTLQLSNSKSGSEKTTTDKEVPSADSGISISETPSGDTPYISRYLTDFEPIQRLGKGGFGVVFEARNMIDDCHYAVKRISLPNRAEAREKVMREVKALAKLDHPGIVRYFNAWQECPPPGWQEHLDNQWDTSGQLSITAASSLASPSLSKPTSPIRIPSNNNNNNHIRNPMSPFEWSINDTQSSNKTPKFDDESGSFSYEKSQRITSINSNESSFEIVFQRSHIDDSTPSQQDFNQKNKVQIPFREYASSSRSFRVVPPSGEDSGCMDHSQSTESEVIENLGEVSLFNQDKPNRPYKLDLIKPASHSVQESHSPPGKLYQYIQMQLCKKETLKDWLTVNTTRERDNILDIFDQIVSAVQYVHDCNLMHRDLKPSNIFFLMDGTVKVGDFGLVTTLSENEAHTPSEASPNQPSNNIPDVQKSKSVHHTDQVGTQLYMSPEQIAAQPYSQKVDVYSLGLIFFELLVPFPTQMERLKVITNLKKHIFPEDFRKNSPKECEFVQQLLAQDPCARPSVIDVKQHPLLEPYQPKPEQLNRFLQRRRRTLSQRASSSGSEGDHGSAGPIEDDCPLRDMVDASS